VSTVEVDRLRVELAGGVDVIDDVSFTIEAGELVGLVGESGSGKTTAATALLGHARRGARIAGGSVRVDGTDVLALDERGLTRLRGKVVSYIPQDPSASLNPAHRLELQLDETLRAHGLGATKRARLERIEQVLSEVKLPGDREFLRKYPHQLSGGQQQRVVIALAFLCDPKVLVLDEPTTGLDVTTQARVLATVRNLCERRRVAALYVTHDLAVVANMASRVLVMYAGRVVEAGARAQIFGRSAHPYTRELLAATPDIRGRRALPTLPGHAPPPGMRPTGCSFHPRCPARVETCQEIDPPPVAVAVGQSARCIRADEIASRPTGWQLDRSPRARASTGVVVSVERLDAFYGARQVLHDVSLELHERECLALVGESGSGKTTLARCIAGLHTARASRMSYRGEPLDDDARRRPPAVRRSIQYIFQSPYNSLNPRKTVAQIIGLPLEHFFPDARRESHQRVLGALERVALPSALADRYPDQLSGGERQRVAIARALICEPNVLICDEITSALDVSVQAAIIELLRRLQREYDLSLLFVTHNLALVRSIADRILVLNNGTIVEHGQSDSVIDDPREPYTRKLLADTPSLALAQAT